jgi:predicted HTH domain antitoxin
MAQQQRAQLPQKEGRLSLSIQAIQKNQILSVRRAAKLYDISRTSLQRRVKGVVPKAQSNARKRKLQLTEEQSLVDWILALDRRGFPPHIIDVRRMADTLLAARGQQPAPQPVGKNWVSRFINAQPELQTKWNRKFHS